MNSIVLILPLLAVYTTVTRSANTSNPAWTEKYAEGCELRVRVIVANSLVSRPSRSGLTAPVALIRAVVAGDCHPSYARLFDIHGCAAISLPLSLCPAFCAAPPHRRRTSPLLSPVLCQTPPRLPKHKPERQRRERDWIAPRRREIRYCGSKAPMAQAASTMAVSSALPPTMSHRWPLRRRQKCRSMRAGGFPLRSLKRGAARTSRANSRL